MAVVEGLLRFALGAIHASTWLRDAIYLSLLWFWTGLVYAVKHKGSKLECIREDTKDLKKIPQHLTLIVHEERLSHTDLANVVTWAFAAGIHHVSIYNSQGDHIYKYLINESNTHNINIENKTACAFVALRQLTHNLEFLECQNYLEIITPTILLLPPTCLTIVGYSTASFIAITLQIRRFVYCYDMK